MVANTERKGKEKKGQFDNLLVKEGQGKRAKLVKKTI